MIQLLICLAIPQEQCDMSDKKPHKGHDHDDQEAQTLDDTVPPRTGPGTGTPTPDAGSGGGGTKNPPPPGG